MGKERKGEESRKRRGERREVRGERREEVSGLSYPVFVATLSNTNLWRIFAGCPASLGHTYIDLEREMRREEKRREEKKGEEEEG